MDNVELPDRLLHKLPPFLDDYGSARRTTTTITTRYLDSEGCGREVLFIRPHLLGDSAPDNLLLNLREDEKLEEVLEDKDEEEEEREVDAKVNKVREYAQLMHATWWWLWDGMRRKRKRKHLEPVCDVQGMSVTTAKPRLATKTATLRACSRFPQVL